MFIKQNIWHGINSSVSDRLNHNHLKTCINGDTNIVEGEVRLRRGYKIAVDDTTTDINKFIEYRDEENSKDVMLVLDKDSTVGSRKLWHYTKTAKATAQYIRSDGAGPPAHSAGITYGNVELGDSDFGVSYIMHRNHVKIGTGTGTNNKALDFGYWNRENFFNVDALDFSGYFITKQQWVQQCNLFSWVADVKYDTVNDKFYVLTLRGLEIRDGDLYLERILTDVVGYHSPVHADYIYTGGIAIDGDYLYVAGRDATSATKDTLIVRYDISEGYAKGSDTYSKTAVLDDYIHDIVHDGSKLYCTWHNGTDGFIREIPNPSTDLATGTERYGGGFGKALFGITEFGDFIYVVDPTNAELTKMDKDPGYTATVYTSAGASSSDIAISGPDPFSDRYLMWTTYATSPTIYSIDIADLVGAGAIAPTTVSDGTSEPLSILTCINIASNSHVLVYSAQHGYFVLYIPSFFSFLCKP